MTEQPGPVPIARELGRAVLALAALKALVLLLDPNPRFFLWDSVTYIRGAIDWGLPRDRSMLYSLLIEAIALPARSLHALVVAQTIAGVASALLVFAMLRRLLGLPFAWALAPALLLAVEPSQLFYERMVLAEAFGMLAWLSFVALVLLYCRDARWWVLPLIALAGIWAISYRLNPTLTVLAVGALLPLWRAWFVRRADPDVAGARLPPAVVAAHLALAVACAGALHTGYRHVIGHFAHTAPGYIGVEGLFRLGFVAPQVQAEHFEGTGCPPDILGKFKLPLADPYNREGQLWGTDGLWPAMQRWCKNPEEAATIVSERAAREHPLAIFPMAFATAADYFNDVESEWRMESDIGHKGQMPLELIEPAKRYFYLDVAPMAWAPSLTEFLFKHSRAWLPACLFGLPLLAALAAFGVPRARRQPAVLGLALIAAWIFSSQLFFSHIISFRYLHPFPPLVLMLGTVVAWRVIGARRLVEEPVTP